MPKNKHKILAIDDEQHALLLLEAMLESHNYDVVMLNTNIKVIEAIRKEKPDLILLDIMMPYEDGYTILNRIKTDDAISNIPIVMVSALAEDGHKVIASIQGASAYVTKPIDKKVLLETIAHFLPDSTS